jgi:hypothetical protein
MVRTTKRTTKRLHVDAESRALMANPAFREALASAKRTPPADLIDSEELDRRRPLTREEIAAADARLDALERDSAARNRA